MIREQAQNSPRGGSDVAKPPRGARARDQHGTGGRPSRLMCVVGRYSAKRGTVFSRVDSPVLARRPAERWSPESPSALEPQILSGP
jgi:hypothetical protein